MFDPDDYYDDFHERLENEMNDLSNKVIKDFSGFFVDPKSCPVEEILKSIIMAAWEEKKYGVVALKTLHLDEMEMCSVMGDLKEFEKLWIEKQEDNFKDSDIFDDRCF